MDFVHMSRIGHIEEFDVSNPSGWMEYSERLQLYLEANEIRDSKEKVAVLCSVCGSETYSVLRLLTHPDPPFSKSFEEVLKLLSDHFFPKSSEVCQRILYQRRVQRPGESISAYAAELRRLAQYCNFGETLESRLRDQLVYGLRDRELQIEILCSRDLTYRKALDIALSAEIAATARAQMQLADQDASEETQVTRRGGRPRGRTRRASRDPGDRAAPRETCYRCGGSHSPRTCRFKSASCDFCGRIGHIERACRGKSDFLLVAPSI